jgi:hypothetical protein
MNVDRKRTEEEKIIYQQACEEGALRGAASLLLTLCPNTASGPDDRSDQGKLLAQWMHHKIPEISICRRRRFLDSTDWLSKTEQSKWNKKNAEWVWEQTKKHKKW